jgi:DNA polymerase III sliding clamp (beta) subunit (PCNA family)
LVKVDHTEGLISAIALELRLLEGNYPDTTRLIRNEQKMDVVVNTKIFLRSKDIEFEWIRDVGSVL